MTRSSRGPARAVCALGLVMGLLAPLPARAQIAHEQVAGVEVKGAYLVDSVTEADPADGGRVVVDDVAAFDPRGGLAIFEPASAAREVFEYGAIDEDTSELVDVVRTAPRSHPGGSFVQAIDNASPSPQPSESPSSRPRPRERPRPQQSGSPQDHDATRDSPAPASADTAPPADGGFGNAEEQAPQPRSFTTTSLVSAAAQLRGLGWSERWARAVYAPFPVAGAATFMDTWGALRYGPAPGQVRGHEGQDIFCDFGAPILAVTRGRIDFDSNGLGGRIARLHMSDGSYWYYAHLSRWNGRQLSSGDRVQPGDVIGYCGHSGSARTTPDHLHFGWYSADEEARNPMGMLVGWLRTARADAAALVRKVERRLARRMEVQMLGRMFGDSWAPDLTSAAPPPPAATPPTAPPGPSTSPLCDPGMVAPPTDASPPPPCASHSDGPSPGA